ncbi:MAG: ParA family protein [Gammaproteobacteria bacterium]|nr:ParA family protein [Gammaproteobacteria bacterium]
MTIIALVGNKGGAGKTTLCVNLASALNEIAPTVILDADPQRSSLQWRALSDNADAVSVQDAVDDLETAILGARRTFTNLVIDCPPSVHAEQTAQALESAELALIPVQPSPLDLWATVHIEGRVETARRSNPDLHAVLVINQLEPRTTLSKLMREALSELSVPAAATAIRRRMAFRTAVLEGRSVLDLGSRGRAAADEIRALIKEVVNR